jgi:site-specific DNA recombinase
VVTPPWANDVAPNGGVLVVNPAEAERVREMFRLYLQLGSLIPAVEELDRCGWCMKVWTTRDGRRRGGASFNKTTVHNLLTSVIYTGRVKFDGQLYAREHERIVDDDTFNRVQDHLQRNGHTHGRSVGNKGGGLLKGLVRCGSCGAGMTHTYTQKKNTRYRYYVCVNAHQRGWNKCETRSVSAPELEGAVVNQIRGIGRQPAMLSEVLRRLEEGRAPDTPMGDPGKVADALLKFDPLWDQFTTWEQETFIRTLVAQVRYDGRTGEVTVGFHSEGIKQLCATQGVGE